MALHNKEHMDFSECMPTLNSAFDPADKAKEISNVQYKAYFNAQIKAHVEREERYRSNATSAYALLFLQCNKAMQAKIRARRNFESQILNNPIALLAAIEEHSVSYNEKKYLWRTRYVASAICDKRRAKH